MQVKVSKTIRIEQVPEYVTSLMLECKKHLDTCSQKLLLSIHDVNNFVSSAQEAQNIMSDVAENIQDCINIANGWQEAQLQSSLPTMQEEEQAIEEN